MGCTSSEPYTNVYSDDELRKSKKFFESLKLAERDVGKLFEVFKTIDRSKSSGVTEVELLEYLGVQKSNFFAVLMGFADLKKLQFEEFVKVIWRFLSLPTGEIVKFVFAVYDHENRGFLDLSQVDTLFADINDSKALSGEVEEYVRECDDYNFIPVDKFVALVQAKCSVLFEPAFEIYRCLRRRILGEKFWNHQQAKRANDVLPDIGVPKREPSMRNLKPRQSSFLNSRTSETSPEAVRTLGTTLTTRKASLKRGNSSQIRRSMQARNNSYLGRIPSTQDTEELIDTHTPNTEGDMNATASLRSSLLIKPQSQRKYTQSSFNSHTADVHVDAAADLTTIPTTSIANRRASRRDSNNLVTDHASSSASHLGSSSSRPPPAAAAASSSTTIHNGSIISNGRNGMQQQQHIDIAASAARVAASFAPPPDSSEQGDDDYDQQQLLQTTLNHRRRQKSLQNHNPHLHVDQTLSLSHINRSAGASSTGNGSYGGSAAAAAGSAGKKQPLVRRGTAS